MIPMQKRSVSSVNVKIVQYTNTSSLPVAAGQSQYTTDLVTSDNDLSGYIPLGVIGYNTYGGSGVPFSLKALSTSGAATGSISAAISNPMSSSVTIPANAITVDVRLAKFNY